MEIENISDFWEQEKQLSLKYLKYLIEAKNIAYKRGVQNYSFVTKECSHDDRIDNILNFIEYFMGTFSPSLKNLKPTSLSLYTETDKNIQLIKSYISSNAISPMETFIVCQGKYGSKLEKFTDVIFDQDILIKVSKVTSRNLNLKDLVLVIYEAKNIETDEISEFYFLINFSEI